MRQLTTHCFDLKIQSTLTAYTYGWSYYNIMSLLLFSCEHQQNAKTSSYHSHLHVNPQTKNLRANPIPNSVTNLQLPTILSIHLPSWTGSTSEWFTPLKVPYKFLNTIQSVKDPRIVETNGEICVGQLWALSLCLSTVTLAIIIDRANGPEPPLRHSLDNPPSNHIILPSLFFRYAQLTWAFAIIGTNSFLLHVTLY